MKRAYKQAMDRITLSDQIRIRVLAAAACPKSRYNWVKPVCGAAACFVLLCTMGIIGMGRLNVAPEMAKDAAESAKYTADTTAAVSEAACLDAEEAGEAAFDDAADTAAGSAEKSTAAKSECKADENISEEAADSDGVQTLIANPVVRYASLEKAEESLDFDPVIPDEAADGDVSVIGGEILQLCWEEGVISYTYRTAEGGADVSGIYARWDVTETVQAGSGDMSFTVTLMGNGETVSLALWERDGMTFSLSAEPGIPEAKFISLID